MLFCTYFAFFFLFSTVEAQSTYWIGCLGSSNCTWNSEDHWSDGIPTNDSIVYINDTNCSGCTILLQIEFDVPELTVKELYITAQNQSGPYLIITGKLIVSEKLVLGSANNSNSDISIELDGGELVFGDDSEITIYLTSNPISTSFNSTGRLVNNGTITVLHSGTPTSSSQIDIGDRGLIIDNWGNWVSTDPLIGIHFYNLSAYNHFGGWYNSTFYKDQSSPSFPIATLEWVNSDFYIEGVENTEFYGPVYFNSSSEFDIMYFNNAPRVVFNTPDIVLSNALFNGVNIFLNYDGWIVDSNFTGYTNVNSTNATAYINGKTIFYDTVVLTALDDAELQVIIEDGAEVSGTASLGIFGSVVFINNGTIRDINWRIYLEQNSSFINLGLIELSNNKLVFTNSYFIDPSVTGTVVNRGTIQLVNSSSFWMDLGDYLQCDDGIIKLGLGVSNATDTFGTLSFTQPSLDGHISVYFGEDFLYSENVFLFRYQTDLKGNISQISTWEDLYDVDPQQVCVDNGFVYLYPIKGGSCTSQNSGSTSDIPSFEDGENACSCVPENIMALIPSCSVDSRCGSLNTRIPSDPPQSVISEPQPESQLPSTEEDPPGSALKDEAALHTSSISLIICLVGYLFFQLY